MSLVESTGGSIPTSEITADHIKTFVTAAIARDGIEAVTLSGVSRAFGVSNAVIINRLRVHFSDFLAANYAEHRASVPIEKARRVLNAALHIATTRGFPAVTLQAVADELGIASPNVSVYIDSLAALRSKVIHEVVAQGKNPEIIAAGIVLADPAVAALDIEAKRGYWRAAEAVLFGIEDIPSKPERHTRPAAGVDAK